MKIRLKRGYEALEVDKEEEYDVACSMFDNPLYWAEKYLQLREAAREYLSVSSGLVPAQERLTALVEEGEE